MMNAPSHDQFVGCLLGQSLGDALALFLRGMSAAEASDGVDQFVSDWFSSDSAEGCPEHLFITEGTQLSWELVRLYIEEQAFLPSAFTNRIKELFNRRLVFERYWETHLAVNHLRSGVPWYKSGVESFGCGSIHRASAIGAILWNQDAKRRVAAEQQSLITHANRDVGAASVLVADFVASLLRGECGPNCESLMISIPEGDARLGPAFARLSGLFDMQTIDALASIAPLDGIQDDVEQSLLWALYCVAITDWNFAEAVKLALRCGGELVAPTAIVGAMCGAVQGAGVIPAWLLDRLSDRGIFGKSDFWEWCTECYEITLRASPD